MTARTPRATARRLFPWTIGAFAVVLAASAGVATYRARLPHPTNAPAHRVCARGEQASYAFRLAADGRVHPITLGGSASNDAAPLPYTTTLEGELRVTCTGDADASGSTAALLELHDVRVQSQLPPALARVAPTPAGLEALLATVTVTTRGRFDDLRLPAAASASEKNALRTLLSFTSVVLPEAPASSWTTEEAAPMATLATSYAATAKGTAVELAKTERAAPVKTGGSNASTVDGHCAVGLDQASGAPLEHRCDRHEESRLGALVVHAASTTFEARRTSTHRLDEAALAALIARANGDALARVELSPADEREATNRAADAKLLEGQTLAAVVDRLHQGGDEGPDGRILEAFVRREPSAVPALAKVLRDARSNDRAFGTVARVLVEEGGAAGQHAVVEATSLAKDDLKKQHVLTAHLGFANGATPETEKHLRSLRTSGGEVARTADLALGNLAHDLLASDPARALSITDELAKSLAAATTPAEKVHALRALGNIGGDDLLAIVTPFLDDPSEDVRQIAAASLRRVSSERATELLVSKATFDTSAIVRAVAVASLASEPPPAGLTETLAKLLARERSAVALREIVLKLRTVMGSDPGARQVLTAYDRTCAQAEVCSLVKQVLTAS